MAFASATTSPDTHKSYATGALTARFDALRAEQRKALVCYVTAGHPDVARSLQLLQGLEAAGADVVEVGVPFSDPLADGPVIQESSQIAIAQGMNLSGCLALIAGAKLSIPVVLFSYLNPIIAAGPGVLERARAAGVSGILATDLPVGADPERERWLGTSGLDFIRLVAPTTPAARMGEIGRNGGGFVYLISRMGVTGEQTTIAAELPETIARLRSVTSLPVCVGFGISTPEQARSVAGLADGVVVGSALVRAANSSIAEALALVSAMRRAMDE
ncbi:MAG: tryptophan synthase subunit alpha [Gemmatimonadota bacterium]|nr:tryptophan synthase subunit alpha [Gemmatimonadota bacterium]